MFFDRDIKGDRLPPKTLCLTYDDGPGETPGDGAGPGPRTLELGRYLHGQGIGATFFVVGSHAAAHPDAVRRLRGWGHLVGNHTWSHPGLVKLAASGGDVVGELARTDDLLRGHAPEGVVYFRAPYGNWREKRGPGGPDDKATSVVADILNRSGRIGDHVGPVNWDVSAADYDFWRRGASAGECARAYVDRAERVGSGIVLMHDSSEEEALRANNRTLRATQIVVEALRRKGYRFVRLDEVPQVESARRVRWQVALRTPGGDFLARAAGGGFTLSADEGEREAFGVVPLGGDRIALRAGSGLYLSAGRGGEVLPGALAPADGETLGPEDLGGGKVACRVPGGHRLGWDRAGGRLVARPGSSSGGDILYLHKLFAGSHPRT